MITIDKRRAWSMLKAAVREFGRDHVDYDYSYSVDGEGPSCIVTPALWDLPGMPDVMIANGSASVQWVVNRYRDGGYDLLRAAQNLQDGSGERDNHPTWGYVLDQPIGE